MLRSEYQVVVCFCDMRFCTSIFPNWFMVEEKEFEPGFKNKTIKNYFPVLGSWKLVFRMICGGWPDRGILFVLMNAYFTQSDEPWGLHS